MKGGGRVGEGGEGREGEGGEGGDSRVKGGGGSIHANK